MGPKLIGDDLYPSRVGMGVGWVLVGGGWSEVHLECVHRQITFAIHD